LRIVAYDRIDCLASCADNRLHDVSEVIDDEVEVCAALRDGAEEAVHGAYYSVDHFSNITEQGNQQRIQIQRLEYPLYDIHEMAQPHNKLQLSIHVRNCDIDFRDRDCDSGIDFHQVGDVGVEIDVCDEIVYV